MRFDVPKPAKEFITLRYPHMSELESRIWTEFLRTTDLKFYWINYDVRVGPGYVPEYITEENIRRMALALTKLRIDAVGETDEAIWIFEVKPRAGRTALGQLESYVYWYVHDYKPKKPVIGAVVCIHVDPNIERLFRMKQYRIFTVRLPDFGEGYITINTTG